jgi:hypothetical protein
MEGGNACCVCVLSLPFNHATSVHLFFYYLILFFFYYFRLKRGGSPFCRVVIIHYTLCPVSLKTCVILCRRRSSIIAQEKSRELDMWVLGKDKPTYFCLFRPFFFLEKTATRLLCNKQNNLKNRQSLCLILYPFSRLNADR